MKLKTVKFEGAEHEGPVTSVAWSSNDEVFSSGDDHTLMQWNFVQKEATILAKVPEDVYITSLQWFPKSGNKKKDLLLAACADGKYHFLNKNGRFDKTVEAHQGAVLVALWSFDGAGLLTGGEDGQVKIWSKTGLLRSTVVSGDVPVYTAAWGPTDSNHILVAQGRSLLLKPLTPNSKPIRWRAHDGLILALSWQQSTNLIVSGGEDCRYRLWDSLGHALYTSSIHDYSITSVAWAPAGDLFAVASFNTIRLCDRIGWSHSMEKVDTGTIYDLAWSLDGTQLTGACGNGCIIISHVVNRKLEWKNYQVTLNTQDTVLVKNVLEDTEEQLEFGDRVAKMEMEFNHLVVTTSAQCYIYSTSNWNTPIMIPLKDGPVTHLSLTKKYFSMVEKNNLNIYGYDGKLEWSPKFPNIQLEVLDSEVISFSDDTLVVVDQGDPKIIHILDLRNNRPTAPPPRTIQHTQGVIRVTLSQTGRPESKMLAFIDRNRDAYLSLVRGSDRRTHKISSMVSSLQWGAEAPLLAAVRDSILSVWCCPTALLIESQLLRRVTFSRDISEMGKGVSLVSFIGNMVSLRRSDGSLLTTSVPPFVSVLHRIVDEEKWDDALRLCRTVKDDMLWACLACLATTKKEIMTAEEAFSAINEFDKVSYLQYVKSLSIQPLRSAHLALLSGNFSEAESILLMNGLIFRAIILLTDTHKWNRALELAVKHRTHVDTVLYKRKQYLDSFDKKETNEKFIQFASEVDIDPITIREKIDAALAKESQNI